MASDVVIRAEGLGKKYVIGHLAEGERHSTLRDTLARGAGNVWRKTVDMARGRALVAGDSVEEFWALKDVSFEVKRGEVLGIIGPNGAGKSTLLKILSRITEPSEGRATIDGRVASLLEVGTGFHPELTGRENIFLNGAILGMTRAEIKRRFDEIVAFAEVEKFLDTPVKRYSSGMYVRLAFAVAAHLEPEILIVDEVLSVGDAQFQKKCLGKMQDVASHGRTVLFVSHSLQTVAKLCNSAMLLKAGNLTAYSNDVDQVIHLYRDSGQVAPSEWIAETPRTADGLTILGLRVSQDHQARGTLRNDKPIDIDLHGALESVPSNLTFGIAVYSSEDELLFWSYPTDIEEEKWPKLTPGEFHLSTSLPARFLNEGRYRVEFIASLHYQRWIHPPNQTPARVEFEISGGLSDSPFWHERRPGLLAPVLSWNLE